MLVSLFTSPHACKQAIYSVCCIVPAHSVASLNNNILFKHPRMHNELNFLTLDRIYEQAMRDGEEKLNSLLIMDDVTTSHKNLGVQRLF